MEERLKKHGFQEKRVVPDGNCQMRALSDQIWGDENRHKEVRTEVTTWLDKNEKFTIDDNGTSTLGDFIDRDQFPQWSSYVKYMAKDGSWGDHITLFGAAETYGVTIVVLSNVDDNGAGRYLTSIVPRTTTKPKGPIHLSHWHEFHYNSLRPINADPREAA